MIANRVSGNRSHLGAGAIDDCQSQAGEREDLAEQPQVDPLRCGFETRNLRRPEAQHRSEVTLTQVAGAPYPHDQPGHVDRMAVTPTFVVVTPVAVTSPAVTSPAVTVIALTIAIATRRRLSRTHVASLVDATDMRLES